MPTDTATLHLYFLTVFWHLTWHPCQQSPRDLLANGATVGAPCDEKKLRPLSRPSTTPRSVLTHRPSLPLKTLQGGTILFLRCVHLSPRLHFFTISFLKSLLLLPISQNSSYHLIRCWCFSFRPFSWGLIYGGWRAAGEGSYDVWPQAVILICSHMAKWLLSLAKLSLSFSHSFPSPFLFFVSNAWVGYVVWHLGNFSWKSLSSLFMSASIASLIIILHIAV